MPAGPRSLIRRSFRRSVPAVPHFTAQAVVSHFTAQSALPRFATGAALASCAAAAALCAAVAGLTLPVDARAADAAKARADDGCGDLRAALRAGDQRVAARAEVRENGKLTREIELSAGGLRRVFHAPTGGVEPVAGSLSQQFYAEAGLLPEGHARCVAGAPDPAGAGTGRRIQVIGGRESTITLDTVTGLPIRVEQRTDLGGPRVVVLHWGERGEDRSTSAPSSSPSSPSALPPPRGPRIRT